MRDYRPINQTTKRLPIHLTLNTVSFEQFQRFLSYQGANQRVNFGGWFSRLNLRLKQTEEEEDFFRTKLKELEVKYSNLQIVFFVRLNFVFVGLFYILTLIDIVNGKCLPADNLRSGCSAADRIRLHAVTLATDASRLSRHRVLVQQSLSERYALISLSRIHHSQFGRNARPLRSRLRKLETENGLEANERGYGRIRPIADQAIRSSECRRTTANPGD